MNEIPPGITRHAQARSILPYLMQNEEVIEVWGSVRAILAKPL